MNLKDLFLLPNLITGGRLFTSIYLFTQHLISNFSISTLVLIIALIGISDSIDGIVARRLNQVSKLGTILDPVCDRIVFLLLLFWLAEIFPDWFFYGILIREILVMIGSLYVLTKTKCFFVINSGNEQSIFLLFGIFSLIFYYFVALEYFYKIFIKK